MAEIQVTSSALKMKAAELEKFNGSFQTMMTELIGEETILRGQYEGEASDVFHTAFTRDTVKMEEFHNLINQYIQRMLEIASGYEKAEMTNIQLAQNRSY